MKYKNKSNKTTKISDQMHLLPQLIVIALLILKLNLIITDMLVIISYALLRCM